MRAAVEAGASMINDIWALRQDNALATAADLGVPVCLMHMQGTPRDMQRKPHYRDVVTEVKDFLRERIDAALAAGVRQENIVVDPGFGFGKTIEHNLVLLKFLPELRRLGVPVLVGLSRKRMIGTILDKPVDQRLYGSLALAVMAAMLGADMLRVHDVAATGLVIRERIGLDLVLADRVGSTGMYVPGRNPLAARCLLRTEDVLRARGRFVCHL